jgi:asparagine synthase (glutamine-hydrolysing)
MCGIVGSFRPGGEACGPEVLGRMRDRMAHRGPDGVGLWQSPAKDCTFGHRRLSIIDLSNAANQPMVNRGGTVSLIFNGEIYNHADVRRELEALGKYEWVTDHSDTEVLLHAYEEWGLDCVKRFYGMFAVAIHDARDSSRPVLHLIRDRVGIKPLYFARTSRGEWVFGSEIRALLAHPDLSPEMDPVAFWHYLTFIVTPAPLTLFKGIFKMPAGYTITIDHKGRATSKQWWDCKPDASTLY